MSVQTAPVASDPLAIDWQRRRAEFVHDWLRNRFLPRLQACLALARPGVRANRRTVENLYAVIREWPERGTEAVYLSDEFCEVMSPLRVVEEIARSLPPHVASFVRCATVEAWDARHRVAAAVNEIRAAHRSADACYSDWTQSGSNAALRAMAQHCERLARVLSKLPSRIVL